MEWEGGKDCRGGIERKKRGGCWFGSFAECPVSLVVITLTADAGDVFRSRFIGILAPNLT